MKLLITGATGFVGANLVRHFAGQHVVVATGRSATPVGLPEGVAFHPVDLSRPLRGVFPKVEAVIHAAALASDTASEKELAAANGTGTRHLFEATRDGPIFIYISSASVYDNQKTLHLEDEAVDYQRLSAYGRSKRAAEEWLLQQDWSTRTLVILRPRAIYGPGDRVLLPRLLGLVRHGRIISPGAMRIQCSLTHVDNLGAAVAHSLNWAEKQSGGAHIFNIADAQPYEMREVVGRLLSTLHGRELPFWPLPITPLRGLVAMTEGLGLARRLTRFGLAAVSESCVLDTEKIRQVLDFQAVENFYSALPKIAEWAKRIGLQEVKAGGADLPWRF